MLGPNVKRRIVEREEPVPDYFGRNVGLVRDYVRSMLQHQVEEWFQGVDSDSKEQDLADLVDGATERNGVLIGTAYQRAVSGIEDQLSEEQIGDLYGETIGQYVEPGLHSGRMEKAFGELISTRVIHYQELIATEGEFDTFGDLLEGKYPEFEQYSVAFRKIVDAYAHVLQVARDDGHDADFMEGMQLAFDTIESHLTSFRQRIYGIF
tara:strand:- start:17610 stop:18233 length:624 start_codon:yes stop_codon:yes gene_type:complete